jgi:iron complex transport system substrate-binding protein
MKIISLAPTQTEIIAALGQLNHLAGITEDCDFPKGVAGIPTFGTWYSPDLNRVIGARPDLVCTFGRRQEEVMSTLMEAGFDIFHSDPKTVSESVRNIEELAELICCKERGRRVVEGLGRRVERLQQFSKGLDRFQRPGVLRIVHWEPLITVGPGAFQHDAIELAGGMNVMGDGSAPYFVCNPEDVISRNPQAIFFCEPYIADMLKAHPDWRGVDAVRNDRIFVFDCGLTCRSGPRIVNMVEYLARSLYPELAPK